MKHLYAALLLIGILFTVFVVAFLWSSLLDWLKKYRIPYKIVTTIVKIVFVIFIGITFGTIYLNILELFP
jgi:predicted PurR-regulated permease PerM